MQYTDIKTMVAETNLSATYYSWPEDDPLHPVPPLPYLVWYLPSTENVAADDKVYKVIQTLNLELYTATKDFATEATVEAVLDSWGMVWEKQETYIDTEHMYEVLYIMEVIIDG